MKTTAQPSAEPEFYGTMPEKLPDSVPIGTRWKSFQSEETFAFRGVGKLAPLSEANHYSRHGNGMGYVGDDGSPNEDGDEEPVPADLIDWSTVRRLSAPSADKWEPAIGDEVEGSAMGSRFRGAFAGYTVETPDQDPILRTNNIGAQEWELLDGSRVIGVYVDKHTLRPATPSPKAAPLATLGSSTLPRPQNMPIHWPAYAGQAPKLDPDGYLNREALDERRRGERLSFGARRLAAVQAHKLDLDRKLPTVRGRLAEEVKAALRVWPEAEED